MGLARPLRAFSMKKKIVYASQDKVKIFGPQLEKIREAIGIQGWFITDESMLCDFGLNEEEILQLSNTLGVKVRKFDFLTDIAERILRDVES